MKQINMNAYDSRAESNQMCVNLAFHIKEMQEEILKLKEENKETQEEITKLKENVPKKKDR